MQMLYRLSIRFGTIDMMRRDATLLYVLGCEYYYILCWPKTCYPIIPVPTKIDYKLQLFHLPLIKSN